MPGVSCQLSVNAAPKPKGALTAGILKMQIEADGRDVVRFFGDVNCLNYNFFDSYDGCDLMLSLSLPILPRR